MLLAIFWKAKTFIYMIGGVTIGEIINKDWRIDPPKRVTSTISDPPATSM